MAASKHGWSYTHTSVQCSPTSVGLTQALPNYNVAEVNGFDPQRLPGSFIHEKKPQLFFLKVINVKRLTYL